MSRVAHAQVSFNGGEISNRLRSRIDQTLRKIAVQEMTGFAPSVEGPAEAMPGLIHVAPAAGPCRLLRFEYNVTQGHVIEASHLLFRVYTNDALLLGPGDVPLTVASPFTYAELAALSTHQSFDVLYCFHGAHQPRLFTRTGAAAFQFDLLDFTTGPFDPRNKDKSLRVSASALTGAVTLTATSAIFAAGDVGSIFQMEAEDFGDTPAWEPGITVTAGEMKTSLERVYRAATSGRTGSWQPSHTEGIEWDGAATGTDINSKPAGGVQWEFVHDKFGIVKITGFTSGTQVTGTVLRHLPFSSVGGGSGTGNYAWTGGYYDSGWGIYIPPTGAVDYGYGTWRWRFGAFSNTRGWPTCGVVWNERLWLAKDSRLFASVAGDLTDFARVNELGDVSDDMAITITLDDPNAIRALVADEKLIVLTAAGTFAVGPASAAAGISPKNTNVDRQTHTGVGLIQPIALDSRTIYVDRTGKKILQNDFDANRGVEGAQDLTRYARHIGLAAFVALASQRHADNRLWVARGDGSLACASYLPEEDVLAWAQRPLATGLAARSLTSITDPAGQFDQVWVAAEFAGQWHVLRMAPWREDGEADDTAVMLDMAFVSEGSVAADHFTAPLLANRAIQVVADGAFYALATDGGGGFDLPVPALRVVAGLPYPAAMELLPIEAGGDNGPAMSKMARASRAWIDILDGRGLAFGAPGALEDLEQLADGDPMGEGWDAESTFRLLEVAGDHTRVPRLRVERRAPFQATIRAIGCTIEVQQR